MSLLDTASLVITPNGTKAGKLYSVVPSSGAGDMTVTRATTATRVNSAGLIESVASNIPRLDYSNGTCPSILVEPQRTNSVLRSQEFDNATWGAIDTTITANTTISPSGNTDAETMTITSGASRIFQTLALGSGIYTASIYVKSLSGTPTIQLRMVVDGADITQSIPTTTNWVRHDFTFTASVAVSFFVVRGESGTGSVAIWGAQLEAGSYATSYIPTTSASVTRNADVISKTDISSLIGQTEGTMFFDLVFPQKSEASYIGISNGTTGSRIILGCESDLFFTFGYGSGAVLSLNTNTRYKIALAYNSTNLTIYANGSLLSTVTGTQPTSFSRFAFDAGNSTGNLISSVNTSALWKTRLTNTQLAQLTTI